MSAAASVESSRAPQRGHDIRNVAIFPDPRSQFESAGSMLAPALREQMESVFQADFSSVRLRTTPRLATQGIRAITLGNSIELAPGGSEDRELLGHELAHVLQQRAGRAVSSLPGQRTGHAMALEREAYRAGRDAALGRRVAIALDHVSDRSSLAVPQASGPLTDAVNAVQTRGGTAGSAMVTERLVQGILQAEGEFLRTRPDERLAEAVGLAGTVGPGQLGADAIADVDRLFTAAAAEFATVHGPAPGTWQDKATDGNWSYFYIAAYLAFCFDDVIGNFHSTPPAMTNQALGVEQLGIARYHGGYYTMRDMRRRIAGEQGTQPPHVSWQAVEAELRSGTATPRELEMERYTQLVRGSWSFSFDITASVLSRRFDVGSAGRVRATILANYSSSTPATATRTSSFTVELRRLEVVGGPGGAVGEGYNPVGTGYRFNVGARAIAEWTSIAPGTYQLHIRKDESEYSADHLIGQGTVETLY